MSKTKEELNTIKEEVETLNEKLAELTEEEIAQVSGGVGPVADFDIKIDIELPHSRDRREERRCESAPLK